jgi:hypothetical protein
VIVGAIADAVGLRMAFALSAVVAICAIPFVFLLPRRKRSTAVSPD